MSALSIRTAQPRQAGGGGGAPALESCHYAAMLAGMKGDPWLVKTAEHLLLHTYLHEPDHRRPLERALLLYAANRVLLKYPEMQTSGQELQEVVRLTVDSVNAGGKVTYADAERAGVGRKRWDKLKNVYHLVLDRVTEAEYALVNHLGESCT